MSDSAFLRSFEEFLERNGRSSRSTPWSVVEEWESFVSEVEDEYNWIEAEYTNELRIRDLLELAFSDRRIAEFEPQISAMRERVSVADARLRKVFLPNVRIGAETDPWWRRGVLSHAGAEYTKDVKGLYGIELPRPDATLDG